MGTIKESLTFDDVLLLPQYSNVLPAETDISIKLTKKLINLRSKKTNFNIEFDKMWIHGLLHLLGYDHVRQKDYKQMLRKEQDILKRVN